MAGRQQCSLVVWPEKNICYSEVYFSFENKGYISISWLMEGASMDGVEVVLGGKALNGWDKPAVLKQIKRLQKVTEVHYLALSMLLRKYVGIC